MTDRISYRQRVATVRGRARAELAALRKERLARIRTGAGTPDAVSATAWLADAAADGRRDSEDPVVNSVENAAPAGEPPVLRLVEGAPEPIADTGPAAPDRTEDGETSAGTHPATEEGGASAEEPASDAMAMSADGLPAEPLLAPDTATPADMQAAPDTVGEPAVIAGAEPESVLDERTPVVDANRDAVSLEGAAADPGPLILEPAAMALAPEFRSERAAEARKVTPDACDEGAAACADSVTKPPVSSTHAEADTASETVTPDIGALAAEDSAAAIPGASGIPPDMSVEADHASPEPEIRAAAAEDDPVNGAGPAASDGPDAPDSDPEALPEPVGNGADGHDVAASTQPVPNVPAPGAPIAAAAAQIAGHDGDPSLEDQLPPVAVREETARESAGDHAAEAAQRATALPPESAASPPPGDLPDIPGVGPGLVWMLQSAGVRSLEDLARAEAQDLSTRLGPISRLLDFDYLIGFARDRVPR
jgi:predicted flap endonuclease-1-like 5' DNA nuclease